MTKKMISKSVLKKVIKTTQKIEGYPQYSKDIELEAKALREKYGIKVSSKR